MRRGEVADAEAIGRLLHEFNSEFDEPTPGPRRLAERVQELLAGGEITVLLAGAGRTGSRCCASARTSGRGRSSATWRSSTWSPPAAARGSGRALMEAAVELARAEGAEYMDLATGEDDTAARGLYESVGFSHRGGKPDGPVTLHYERDL